MNEVGALLRKTVTRGKSMNYAEALALLSAHGQTQLLKYYDELSDEQKRILLSEIEHIDFSIIDRAGKDAERKQGKITPADAVTAQDIEKNKKEYEQLGLRAIAEGKVAAVLLAGGQGTRLGSDAPKGTYNIGVNKKLSIFECQMRTIKGVAEKAGYNFHLFIMTSRINDAATKAFFSENDFFGYPEERIHFFIQGVSPACSHDKKIFLAEKYKPVLTPNGNGGWYSSLIDAGLGGVLSCDGVEWLNVYSVDNVLQKICDPVFVGATIKSGCACSGKVVKKVAPEEKVGVLCKEDGAPTIVEYYELTDELRNRRDADGELTYRWGVILNYLFSVNKLNSIDVNDLPYHLADKKVPHIEDGAKVEPSVPNGYKFETLVVDMIKLMGSCLAVEVVREREFAPVKNKTGVDSVESARELLKLNGVEI